MRYVTRMTEGKQTVRWLRLLAGLAILFALLQGAASGLRSLYGEWGLVVAAITVAAALGVQLLWFADSRQTAWKTLGLGGPKTKGLAVALAICALLLCVFPGYLAFRGGTVSLHPNAAWLALGIFAQAGVAEEVVFRGFLYGHIRRRYSFWRAALISAAPFAVAHLYMFATMDGPIALAALLLSVALSFPFAYLYDLGGRTIWASALAHAMVQGAVKLIVVDDPMFVMVWMAASTVLLWLVFFVSSSVYSRS